MNLNLTLDGITKRYGDHVILADCSYLFDSGKTYAMLGANGSGKSTLLRIAALLEPPDGGAVRYRNDAAPVEPDTSLRRRITLVLPKVGAFNMSVCNNVAYGLAIRNTPPAVIEARVGEMLELVQLADKRKRNALTLSSGETQRLGIARALVLTPEVLFLDEPTAFVDAASRRVIEQILMDFRRKADTTVVFSTHDHDFAEKVADHILQLSSGRLSEERP